jgi:hypothetical protein
MKNIFNTKRKKINGFLPYIVNNKGKEMFLFLLTPTTSYGKILEIQHAFRNEEIIFAFKDKRVEKGMQLIDAINFFELKSSRAECIKTYDVFFYENGKFYATTLKLNGNYPNGNSRTDTIISENPSNIELKQ